MPNPECEYCGEKIEESEDVPAVTVEKISGPRFRWNESRIDLDSYTPQNIVFYHLPCWRDSKDAIKDLRETLEKQIERAEQDLEREPDFSENLEGWKEGLEDVVEELEKIPTHYSKEDENQ